LIAHKAACVGILEYLSSRMGAEAEEMRAFADVMVARKLVGMIRHAAD
jgi:hypothetical protein